MSSRSALETLWESGLGRHVSWPHGRGRVVPLILPRSDAFNFAECAECGLHITGGPRSGSFSIYFHSAAGVDSGDYQRGMLSTTD